MNVDVEIIYSYTCDLCKTKITLEPEKIHFSDSCSVSYSIGYRPGPLYQLDEFQLCEKCYEPYRNQATELHCQLHKKIFGYDPRG